LAVASWPWASKNAFIWHESSRRAPPPASDSLLALLNRHLPGCPEKAVWWLREFPVGFRNGSIYEYFAVPETIFSGLLGAASAGRYHHRWIRTRFRYRRIQ
jgi:hypothetical protein